MSSDTIGTWFPSGYYGHFRSKCRNGVDDQYRTLAKPTPPRRFDNLVAQDARKHVFSRHDNRQAFVNNALYFEEGLGRRRVQSINRSSWKPEFIAWRNPTDFDSDRPVSLYQTTYRHGSTTTTEIAPKFSATANGWEDPFTTTYRASHNHGQPDRERSREIISINNKRYESVRRARASSVPARRLTMAMCLQWDNGDQHTTDTDTTGQEFHSEENQAPSDSP